MNIKSSIVKNLMPYKLGRQVLPNRFIAGVVSRPQFVQDPAKLSFARANIAKMPFASQAKVYSRMRPETAAVYFNDLKPFRVDKEKNEVEIAANVFNEIENNKLIEIINNMDHVVSAKIIQDMIKLHRTRLGYYEKDPPICKQNEYEAFINERHEKFTKTKPVAIINDEKLLVEVAARMLSGKYGDQNVFRSLSDERQSVMLRCKEMPPTNTLSYLGNIVDENAKKAIIAEMSVDKINEILKYLGNDRVWSIDKKLFSLFHFTPKQLIEHFDDDSLEFIMYKEIIPLEFSYGILHILFLSDRERYKKISDALAKKEKSEDFMQIMKRIEDDISRQQDPTSGLNLN